MFCGKLNRNNPGDPLSDLTELRVCSVNMSYSCSIFYFTDIFWKKMKNSWNHWHKGTEHTMSWNITFNCLNLQIETDLCFYESNDLETHPYICDFSFFSYHLFDYALIIRAFQQVQTLNRISVHNNECLIWYDLFRLMFLCLCQKNQCNGKPSTATSSWYEVNSCLIWTSSIFSFSNHVFYDLLLLESWLMKFVIYCIFFVFTLYSISHFF